MPRFPPMYGRSGGEIDINPSDAFSVLVAITGWLLVFSSICVRCSVATPHRFDGEYAPGATANAAERSLDLQDKSSTSTLLLGLGSLILILREIRRRSVPAVPAPVQSTPADP